MRGRWSLKGGAHHFRPLFPLGCSKSEIQRSLPLRPYFSPMNNNSHLLPLHETKSIFNICRHSPSGRSPKNPHQTCKFPLLTANTSSGLPRHFNSDVNPFTCLLPTKEHPFSTRIHYITFTIWVLPLNTCNNTHSHSAHRHNSTPHLHSFFPSFFQQHTRRPFLIRHQSHTKYTIHPPVLHPLQIIQISTAQHQHSTAPAQHSTSTAPAQNHTHTCSSAQSFIPSVQPLG